MKSDISLTTTRSTSQEEADTFIGAMTSRGFSVIKGRINDRYGDKVYIAFTLCPMEIPAAANKGGRPRKLTDEQIDEIKPAYRTHPSAAPHVSRINSKEKEERAYRLLSAYCRYLEDCRTRYAPGTPQDAIHPLFVLSLHQLELYRYYRDIFIYNDTEERMTFIEEHGALLERLAMFFSQKAA